MVSYVRSSIVHGTKNRFLESGCNIVFHNRIFVSRDSLILLFLPFPLPDIVLFVPLSMIMSMY